MNNRFEPVSAQAFEDRYSSSQDPWNYRGSSYERSKYATTLSVLRKERYERAFEPGCSIGELTALLASRCDYLLATDFSATAVARARQRCQGYENVQLQCQDLGNAIPEGPFDLVILSEIGYYFDRERLACVAQSLARTIKDGGELIAVHWTGRSSDHVLHGDEVHAVLNVALPFTRLTSISMPSFRLEQWVKE